MQLRALAWLQHAEDNHADEGADELREGGEQVQDAKVDACRFAGRCISRVIDIAVEMVEAEEGGGGRGGGEVVVGHGEAAVGGAVGEHGVWGRETVDFDAHECEWCPAGKGPWSVRGISRVTLGG